MNTNESKAWQTEEALKRFQMISPLLDESLDRDKRLKLRKDIAQREEISERSLYRYETAYRNGGFEGLKPKDKERQPSEKLPENFKELVQEAIQLKREVPTRSVNQIILILELENRVAPGVLKRSTLQRHLYDAGFGKKQMKKYNEAQKSSSGRFCKPHRMMLVQADIKYVMKLPIGPKGKKVQCYLCALIDDHSKMILGSGIYDNQEATIVEDCYRKAILSYGYFDATYCDNGSQFISKQLIDALSRLGIRHKRAPVRSGKSKGKIEVFNRLVNSYIAECKAQKVKTLEEARKYWDLYVEEYYHDKTHEGIREYYMSLGVQIEGEGITPKQEFYRDSRPLKFLDAAVVGNAFLHHDTRIVDQGACISFGGRKYEVSTALIGAKVDIAWDPMDTDTITVTYKGVEPIEAKPVVIGEYCDRRPEIPQSMLAVEPEESRFLQGLVKKHEKTRSLSADAISYEKFREGGEADV